MNQDLWQDVSEEFAGRGYECAEGESYTNEEITSLPWQSFQRAPWHVRAAVLARHVAALESRIRVQDEMLCGAHRLIAELQERCARQDAMLSGLHAVNEQLQARCGRMTDERLADLRQENDDEIKRCAASSKYGSSFQQARLKVTREILDTLVAEREHVDFLIRMIRAVDSYGIGSDVEAYCGTGLTEWWKSICAAEDAAGGRGMSTWKHFDPPQNQRVAQVSRGGFCFTVIVAADGSFRLTVRDTVDLRGYLDSWPLTTKQEAMTLAKRMMRRLNVTRAKA